MATGLNGLPSLSYKGVQAATPPNVVTANRAPTINDVKGFYTGDIWLVKDTLQVWMLVPYQTDPNPRLETWTLLNGNETGASTFITDGGTANVSAGTIEIVGGDNITTLGATDVVTINLNGSIVWNATTADLSNGVISIGSGPFLHGYGTNNTFLGTQAGNFILTTGSAVGNTGIGAQTLSELTTGTHNVAVGLAALNDATTSSSNTAIGVGSQTALLTGSGMNTSVGFDSLSGITTGSYNIAIGQNAGSALTNADSSNILIGNAGTPGLSNSIIIGTQGGMPGDQNNTTIAGIYQATIGATENVVLIDDTGLMGSVDQLPVDLGGTGATSLDFDTDGVIYFDGTNFASTTPGTAGYVLTSQGGAGSPPIWSAGSGGGAITFHTDGADATVSSNEITIAGTANQIETSGAGSTVTIALPTDVSVTGGISTGTGLTVISGGIESTGTTILQDLGLGVVQSDADGELSSSDGTDGQILIASSTVGNPPVWANITPGSGISVLNGDGTITIAAVGGGGTGILGINADDANTALPDGFNTINVFGLAGGNISTTATVAHTIDIAITGTTNHAIQIGNATGSLTSIGIGTAGQALVSGGAGVDPSFATLGVAGGGTGATTLTSHGVLLGNGTSAISATAAGTNGQVLIAATGAAPAFATLVSGDGSITFTLGANSIDMRAVGGGGGGGASTFHTDSGDAVVAANAITIAGGLNIGTTGAVNTVTVNLDLSILQPSTNSAGTSGVYALGSSDYTTDRFLHGYGTRNTFVGRQAGNLTLTTVSAVNNTGIGTNALDSLTTGSSNTAVGRDALTSVTSGTSNTAVGSSSLDSVSTGANNTGVGASSLSSVTSGTHNVGIGVDAGSSITTGDDNTAVGYQALQSVTTGSNSCAFGSSSLTDLTSGTHNSAFGTNSLRSATSGGDNSAFGYQALDSVSTGTQNTAVGSTSGGSLTSGTGNTIIGYNSGTSLTSGGHNVIIGDGSGNSLSTSSSSNILIKSAGVAGDVNTIRIGTEGSGTSQINKAYMAGIYNSTTLVSPRPVVIDANGRLGANDSGVGAPSFSAAQTGTVNNILGDATQWFIGTSPGSLQANAILTPLFNNGGGTLYPGNGLNTPASYTAPTNGIYMFGVCITMTPPPPPPMAPPVDPTVYLYIITTGRTFLYNTQVFLDVDSPSGSPVSSVYYSVITPMNIGNTVTFSASVYNPPSGLKTINTLGGTGIVRTMIWGYGAA